MSIELPGRRLLASFACERDYAADRYFASGNVQVIKSNIGCYREAEAKPLSRFGYRFTIENIGRPHLAVIRYPDDKRRFMHIMDGTCYDLTTGVFTNVAQPLSGTMEEIQQIFWPRWNDCSIVFMTYGRGEPAAVSSIEIYELDDLPALDVPADPCDDSRRKLGIQYEDPCGTGASEGAMTHEEWEERVITYARHSGQKLLVYPIVWYHGPQLPFEAEPCDAFDVVVGRDRKQYIRWTTHPEDWLSRMLGRFDNEGLEFIGSLTLLRLGSLMQKMNIDLDSIRAGTDTINNMLWDNSVQAGATDWTPIYNARNYEKALEFSAKGLDMKDFPWAYGEKPGQGQPYHPSKPYSMGPIFSPLHPVVQDAVINLTREIAARYARFRSFKGISFNMWPAMILWFGSLHVGYDDHTIRLFERETGIEVPVNAKASDRFSKRYDFLTYVCRPAWIEWRCKKIHQLFCKIRDIFVGTRPDMSLTLTFWNDLNIGAGASRQLRAKSSTLELYVEAGFDLKLFRNEPGINVDFSLSTSRDRGGGDTELHGVDRPAEHAAMYRDHEFLENAFFDEGRTLSRSGVFIFNNWFESWGEHKWFACEQDDAQSRELAVMNGKPAEGIFRINSKYPEDGFWWNSQLRITMAFPGGVHYMEHYAHAVAEFDACRVMRGGLYLDKAHTGQIQRFALAYRALPAAKFETVGTSTDPAALRTLEQGGKRYFYLVNREYYPVEIELAFSDNPGEVTDLAASEVIHPTQHWHLALAPYELQAYVVACGIRITSFRALPPKDIAARLVEEGQEALKLIERVHTDGNEIPGMDYIASGIASAIEEGRLAWLRRALNSYVMLRCRELKQV